MAHAARPMLQRTHWAPCWAAAAAGGAAGGWLEAAAGAQSRDPHLNLNGHVPQRWWCRGAGRGPQPVIRGGAGGKSCSAMLERGPPRQGRAGSPVAGVLAVMAVMVVLVVAAAGLAAGTGAGLRGGGAGHTHARGGRGHGRHGRRAEGGGVRMRVDQAGRWGAHSLNPPTSPEEGRGGGASGQSHEGHQAWRGAHHVACPML